MQRSVSSPTPSASRPFSVIPTPAESFTAVRRPGVRPPQDVRQTCLLMFAAAPVYFLLAFQTWTVLDASPPGAVARDLWFLLVVAALVGAALAALALPVRRGIYVMWRSAQFGAVVALGVALFTLHQAAKMASTPMLAIGLGVTLTAIVVNMALWSTEVRRWCDLDVEAWDQKS